MGEKIVKKEITARKTWLAVLVSLVDEVIIAVVVGLVLWYFKVKLPVWAWAVLGLMFSGYVFVRTWLVIPSLRRGTVTGAEGMMGLVGEVTEPLKPKGTIIVRGEYWQAICLDAEIEVGENVEVVGMEGLKLEVKRKII